VSILDLNFGINQLQFETLQKIGEKKKVKDVDLKKIILRKKMIFTTDFSSPYIKTRLKVIEQIEMLLTPIENAVEIVKNQTAKIKSQISRTPIVLSSLQPIIQESVGTTVNQNIILICQIFLDPKFIAEENPDKSILRILLSSLQDFVRFCFIGLTSCKYNMEEKHRGFQEMVEKNFGELRFIIENSIQEAKKALGEE